MKRLVTIPDEHHVTCDLTSLDSGEETALTIVFSGGQAFPSSAPKTEMMLFTPETKLLGHGTYYNGSLKDGRLASLHRNGNSLFLYVEERQVPADTTMPLDLCLAAG